MPTERDGGRASAHLDPVADMTPRSEGCERCLAIGGRWVHLRLSMWCRHIGCGDNSPNRRATARFRGSSDPIIQSYQRGDDWQYCFLDDLTFLVDGAPSSAQP